VEGTEARVGAVQEAGKTWIAAHPRIVARLVATLDGADVLVNAAGMAAPSSNDLSALMDANAVLPIVVAEMASRAGVPRMIHVSSGSVQGRKNPLDETLDFNPFSPYTDSKVAGERALALRDWTSSTDVIIYRPTSVQAPDRPITRKLVHVAARRLVLLPGRGDSPIPVCLIENVGRAIQHLVAMDPAPRIVLQPWEGMTTRRLFEAFNANARFLRLPSALVNLGLGFTLTVGRHNLQFQALARRMELLSKGQGQDALALERAGFAVGDCFSAYRAMSTLIRCAG